MITYQTAENVRSSHPDKVCDYISDSILDAYLAADPYARVACETLATKGHIVLAGEITSTTRIDAYSVTRRALEELGYSKNKGTLGETDFHDWTHKQSPDIAQGVDTGGAGDQGIMFGYATCETPECLPLASVLARRICQWLDTIMETGVVQWLMPDGKAQVTLEYRDGKPARVHSVVVSVQHRDDVHERAVHELVREIILPGVFSETIAMDDTTEIHINPTGRFVVGGMDADTGLTGRKLVVDNWGCAGHIGGGAFSGKDPTKVDRSGAYAARQAAKAVVDSGMAHWCEVALAYAIGHSEPVMIDVKSDAFISDSMVKKIIVRSVDFTPSGIIKRLGLRAPIYAQTARNGHFGIEDYPWEQTEGLLQREDHCTSKIT